MIGIGALVIASSVVFAGTKLVGARHRILNYALARRGKGLRQKEAVSLVESDEKPLALRKANQAVVLTTIGIGATTLGLLVMPAFLLIGVPLALPIAIPIYRSAYQTLRKERRTTRALLDATRITVCIVMGYYFALALDVWLHALSDKMLLMTDDEFERTLAKRLAEPEENAWLYLNGVEIEKRRTELTIGDIIALEEGQASPIRGEVVHGSAWVDQRMATGDSLPIQKGKGDTIPASSIVLSGRIFVEILALEQQEDVARRVRETLEKAVQAGTFSQKFGERSGVTMAPGMLATFFLMLPFWEANRAAGFLTTSFGSQMSSLGPHTLKNFVGPAVEHGILFKDGRALELLNLVNTVVIDARILRDLNAGQRRAVKETLETLRHQNRPLQPASAHRFAIYLMAGGRENDAERLSVEFGFDDYFDEPLILSRAAMIARLQSGGRMVCYVGDGIDDERIVQNALVAVSTRGAATIESDAAQVVLVSNDLRLLPPLFAMARQFASKQGFNLSWPLLMDLLDIGTTVFVHFGLVYSLLFNYSGQLLSMANARLPKPRDLAPDSPASPNADESSSQMAPIDLFDSTQGGAL